VCDDALSPTGRTPPRPWSAADRYPLVDAAYAVASHWAADGGQAMEFSIACRGDGLLTIAEMKVAPRWDDAGRRAALGALARLTQCSVFGYLADSTRTISGTHCSVWS